jgi:hypothetical protein
MRWLILLFVVGATLAIFGTTRPGREIAKRIGLRDHVKDAAPSADLDYLLDACGGDRALRDRRIAAERERFPALSEAEHVRRAIRRVFAERASSEAGTR